MVFFFCFCFFFIKVKNFENVVFFWVVFIETYSKNSDFVKISLCRLSWCITKPLFFFSEMALEGFSIYWLKLLQAFLAQSTSMEAEKGALWESQGNKNFDPKTQNPDPGPEASISKRVWTKSDHFWPRPGVGRKTPKTHEPGKMATKPYSMYLYLVAWFARIGNSSDSCESAWHAIKIGVSIANDSRESIRANRVANRPCH